MSRLPLALSVAALALLVVASARLPMRPQDRETKRDWTYVDY